MVLTRTTSAGVESLPRRRQVESSAATAEATLRATRSPTPSRAARRRRGRSSRRRYTSQRGMV